MNRPADVDSSNARRLPPWLNFVQIRASATKRVAVYNYGMARPVIHVSEAEATSDFATLLARVRAGTEVVIEHDAQPVAVLHAPQPARRTISECVALLSGDSTSTIDPDFAADVEAAIDTHRESLNPPAWD